MKINERYMLECLELAKKGAGYVSPNPMVGCVIVKNDKVIGRGYHEKFGGHHAEINAIINAAENGHDITGATLYVNLEPCAHYGKTPPCTDTIIRNQIKEVVIGMKDPNPITKNIGSLKLKKYGVKVRIGILEEESKVLNKFFIKHITTGIPYITLKAAQSIDGKIADINYDSKWISSKNSRTYVHELRSMYDAVLVGKNTVRYDNPSLTVRLSKGRNPYRIIMDSRFETDVKSKVYSDKFNKNTILVTTGKANKRKLNILDKSGVKILIVKEKNKKIDIQYLLETLGKIGITSIIVEGGAEVYKSFIEAGLTDELIIFTAPKFIGKGIQTFNNLNIKSIKKIKSINSYSSGDDTAAIIKF